MNEILCLSLSRIFFILFWSKDRGSLLLDHSEEHAQLFQGKALCRSLVKDISAIGAEIQSLVGYLALEVVW